MFEDLFPDMVAVDSKGNLTGKVVEFCKPMYPVGVQARMIWSNWNRSLGADGDVFHVEGLRNRE